MYQQNDITIRIAKPNDWLYIDSLRKKEGKALGFIPKDAYLGIFNNCPYDGRDRYLYSKVWVTQDNTDLTGFAYVSFAGRIAKIFQICIQEDARRWYRATLLLKTIEDEATNRGCAVLSCRVAFDLDANFFWKAMGYLTIGTRISTWLNTKESKSKRPLVYYEKPLPVPMLLSIE